MTKYRATTEGNGRHVCALCVLATGAASITSLTCVGRFECAFRIRSPLRLLWPKSFADRPYFCFLKMAFLKKEHLVHSNLYWKNYAFFLCVCCLLVLFMCCFSSVQLWRDINILLSLWEVLRLWSVAFLMSYRVGKWSLVLGTQWTEISHF